MGMGNVLKLTLKLVIVLTFISAFSWAQAGDTERLGDFFQESDAYPEEIYEAQELFGDIAQFHFDRLMTLTHSEFRESDLFALALLLRDTHSYREVLRVVGEELLKLDEEMDLERRSVREKHLLIYLGQALSGLNAPLPAEASLGIFAWIKSYIELSMNERRLDQITHGISSHDRNWLELAMDLLPRLILASADSLLPEMKEKIDVLLINNNERLIEKVTQVSQSVELMSSPKTRQSYQERGALRRWGKSYSDIVNGVDVLTSARMQKFFEDKILALFSRRR